MPGSRWVLITAIGCSVCQLRQTAANAAAFPAPQPAQGGGMPSVALRNAASHVIMPVTGMGTGCNVGGCNIGPGSDMVAYNMSLQWLQLGGRRFDAADSYGCEPGIGKAAKASGIPRSEVFFESKIGPGGLPWPLGFNETLQQGRDIARNYSTSYVDLLLIHWPVNYGPCKYHGPKPSIPTTDPLCDTALSTYNERGCRLSTWSAMLQLWREGTARAVGVSNYNSTHIQEIMDAHPQSEWPALNQAPFSLTNGPNQPCNHATHSPDETCADLIKFQKAHGIAFNGYSPFGGKGGAQKTLTDPRLKTIAARHSTSTAQVVLAWQWFAHGVLVNPEAATREYQHENLAFFNISLSVAEVAVLDGWNKKQTT